jgi:hypothetical protein
MLRHVIAAVALVATTLAAAGPSGQAPADEYFGPFKYSAISVRSKIGALGRAYDQRWQDDDSIVHDAGLVESSLRVWAQRYPNDSWLAPTFYHLAQLYQKVQTQVARTHARATYQFLAQTFPKSKEAHFARLRLQQGFPALHAESAVSPTPNPYGSAAPAASVSPSAEPSSAPATSAAPSAGPSAAPNVTPAPAASTAPSAAATATSAPSPQPTSSAKP